MLSPEKTGLLTAFLGSLPERVALRLAKAVEVDRLAGGTSLPHDAILSALRPILRNAAKVERTPMPLRWFCEPFDELLVDGPRKEKRKGRIARENIATIWLWLSQTLVPAEAEVFVRGMKDAVLSFQPDTAKSVAAAFFPVAADAMRKAAREDRKAARLALGGDAALADAEEIAVLLSAAAEVAEVKQTLPHGTSVLSDDLIWRLRTIYERLAAANSYAAAYVAVVAMSRLEHPWEALKLPLHISRQTSDTLIANTDIGLAGEVLLGDIDVHTAAIRVVKHPTFDPEALAEHVREFARLSNGLTQEVNLQRDGSWYQRLMKDRKAVAETMERLMERAPREILAALPVHKTGSYGGGPKAPDISRAPDAEKSERGLRYAHLVVACRKFAAAASFGAAQKAALDEASLHLKSYADDIVREVRAGEGQRRTIAEQYAALAADFMAILFSAEEAEIFRRRSRTAVAAAA